MFSRDNTYIYTGDRLNYHLVSLKARYVRHKRKKKARGRR